MFQPNHQLPIRAKALPIQGPTALENVGQNASCLISVDGMQNGALFQPETVIYTSKKLQDDLEMLGQMIKKHEDNIKILKSEKTSIEEAVLDMQVTLGKYYSSSVPMMKDKDHAHVESEEETLQNILKHEKSAAGILCFLKARHGSQASHLLLTRDVLGIVATLGKVDDDNLSRLLSEFLGMKTMLAVVCKTYSSIKALETYETDGSIIKTSGLHGLGASLGRRLDGCFVAICIETLRPYVGEFVANDSQRRLDLLKPRLPNGESPPGFLGYAVNMINIDNANLSCLTDDGHGLRETLFYNLFSRLQVYRTRADMLQARPCISHGAISLDGGMLKATGVFSLGNRDDVEVKFPKGRGASNFSLYLFETEKQLNELTWKKEKVLKDMLSEQALLEHARSSFESKKQEFIKYLTESSSYMTQCQTLGGQDR